MSGIGPGGCATLTAEVDGITSTNPTNADSDGDGLNDSYEALTLLTDPTAFDTDGDGLSDGVEVNAAYGEPAQASDPRDNNTDDDAFDDGEEDANGNGVVDAGETDPTRRRTPVTRTTTASRTGKRTSLAPRGTSQTPTPAASTTVTSATSPTARIL